MHERTTHVHCIFLKTSTYSDVFAANAGTQRNDRQRRREETKPHVDDAVRRAALRQNVSCYDSRTTTVAAIRVGKAKKRNTIQHAMCFYFTGIYRRTVHKNDVDSYTFHTAISFDASRHFPLVHFQQLSANSSRPRRLLITALRRCNAQRSCLPETYRLMID